MANANASNYEIIYSQLVNHPYFSIDYELSFRPTESDIAFIKQIVQSPNFGITQILEVGCGAGGLGQYVSDQTKIPIISTDLCVSNKKTNMTEFSQKRLKSVISMNSITSVQKHSDLNTLLLASFLLPYDTDMSERYDTTTLKHFKGRLFINVGVYNLNPQLFKQLQQNPKLNNVLVLNETQTGSISLKKELLDNWLILGAIPHGTKIIGGIEGHTYVVAYARKDTCSKCHRIGILFKQCSRCKKVKYCSSECQKNDWTTHKKVCISSKSKQSKQSKQSKSAQGKGKRKRKTSRKKNRK